MIVKTDFGVYNNCYLVLNRYVADNSLAIQIYTIDEDTFVEPLASITKCLDDSRVGATDLSYVDTNNCPWVMDFIKEYGLGEDTGERGHSGYCTYPLIQFNESILEKYMEI